MCDAKNHGKGKSMEGEELGREERSRIKELERNSTNQLKSNGDVSDLAQDERFLTAAVISVSAPEIS